MNFLSLVTSWLDNICQIKIKNKAVIFRSLFAHGTHPWLSWRAGQIVVTRAGPRVLVVIHSSRESLSRAGPAGASRSESNPRSTVGLAAAPRAWRTAPPESGIGPSRSPAPAYSNSVRTVTKRLFGRPLPRFSTGGRGCESLAHGDTAVDKQPFFADMAACYY
jgi:hypothetical protein